MPSKLVVTQWTITITALINSYLIQTQLSFVWPHRSPDLHTLLSHQSQSHNSQ